jgi:putative acetyltransferase
VRPPLTNLQAGRDASHQGQPTRPGPPLTIHPVSPGCEEARALIEELDTEIAALYPESTINGIDVAEFEKTGGYFVVARRGDRSLGCGGFRPLKEGCVEIKRMFVRPEARRHGIGRHILRHLEDEVRRQQYRSMVLETGCQNAEARSLYESEGYVPIPAFLGYVGIPISRCYAKKA